MQGESPPVLVKESHIQTYSRASVCGRTYLGVVYRKQYASKVPIMVVLCKLKVPSLRITVWHHSASLAMLNIYRRDRIFNPQLTVIKNSYNKVNV